VEEKWKYTSVGTKIAAHGAILAAASSESNKDALCLLIYLFSRHCSALRQINCRHTCAEKNASRGVELTVCFSNALISSGPKITNHSALSWDPCAIIDVRWAIACGSRLFGPCATKQPGERKSRDRCVQWVRKWCSFYSRPCFGPGSVTPRAAALLLVSLCLRLLARLLSLHAPREILFPLPTGTPRKSLAACVVPPKQIPQNAASASMAMLLSVGRCSLCICDARRPCREQKVGWWARRHFTTRKRTHLGLIETRSWSLFTRYLYKPHVGWAVTKVALAYY
jgi:hypothetical protein